MQRNLKLALIVAAVIMLFWIWAAIYYTVVGLDPNLARPWTIPLSAWYFRSEPALMTRIMWTGLPVLLAAVIGWLLLLRGRINNDLGDAAFAREKDLKKAGLRASQGVVLGKFRNEYIIDGGQTHVLVAAPTGSGKGVGVVIPNLLSWNGSAIVLDIKGENHKLTSGFRRAHGQRVFVFSPFSPRSHRFNPFDAINHDPGARFNDIQNIATILLPDNEKDPTWSQQGRGLFVAFALYLLDAEGEECTIGNILRHLQTQEDTRDIVKGIMAKMGDRLDPAAQRSFANFSQQEKRMSESVKVGLVGALALWNSASIDAATSATDFDVNALRKHKHTIYVVVSLADLASLRPLLKLFFEQVFSAQLRREPQKDEPHKILFLLDEFESLGTMEGLVDKLPFVRSFGVRMLAIIQGLSQLDQRYTQAGRDKILQGCRHQIYFAANDQQTTQYVSQTLGKTTITTVSKSRSRQGRTTSRQSQARDLMLPQEVRELPPDELILITEGAKPVRANKIRYFKDPVLSKRAKTEPTEIPQLDLDPRPSPRLADIVGEEEAQRILNSGKKGGGGGRVQSPAPARTDASPAPRSNSDFFGSIVNSLTEKAKREDGKKIEDEAGRVDAEELANAKDPVKARIRPAAE